MLRYANVFADAAIHLRLDDLVFTKNVGQLRRAIDAVMAHRRRVWMGQNRLAAILCVMSADPRLGPGKRERYALPVWRDDDLIGGV
jgi:hypothetical protein